MDPAEQRALDDIAKYGCHVIHVLEEGDLPPFSYSVGIHKTSRSPELIIVGLAREVSHWLINEYNRRVRAGERFETGRTYPGFLEGFEVMFRSVHKAHYREHLGWNRWLYGGDEFPTMQCIWPFTTGAWPWDPSASEPDRAWQPLLDVPGESSAG